MKIKAGHRYVRRDGQVTGPIAKTSLKTYPFKDNQTRLYYRDDGRISEQYEYPQDLIKEYKS